MPHQTAELNWNWQVLWGINAQVSLGKFCSFLILLLSVAKARGSIRTLPRSRPSSGPVLLPLLPQETFIHSTSLLSKRDYAAFRKERSTGSGELAIHSMDGRCYKTGGRLGKKLVIKAKLMEGSSVGKKMQGRSPENFKILNVRCKEFQRRKTSSLATVRNKMVHIRKRVQNVLVVVAVLWCVDQPKGHVLFTLKNGSNRDLQPLVR